MGNIDSTSRIIEGYVEAVIGHVVHGWVNAEGENVTVSVVHDGQAIGVADGYVARSDLVQGRPFAKAFSIPCARTLSPADLVTGELKVVAATEHGSIPLALWRPLGEAGKFSSLVLADLRKAWPSVPSTVKKEFLQELGDKVGGRGFGRISNDGVVQVGRNGYLFLTSGQNHLSKFYTGELELELDRWVECFMDRRRRLEAQGIRYVQVVLPEKSSVLHEYAPFTVAPGSPPFLELINGSLKRGVPLCNVLPELLAVKDKTMVYPYGDSHFSTFGAEVVVKAILHFLGECWSHDPPKAVRRLRAGDLAGRFADEGDIQELEPMYDSLVSNGIASKPELVSSTDPEEGHQGTIRVWRNSSALINKKVLCFGNSFFERGDLSNTLSWWFARLYAEFHFVWTPDLDMDYVMSVAPDIVICQSIERFLTKPPQA